MKFPLNPVQGSPGVFLIVALVIAPLISAGLVYAVTKGGLRMRDGRILNRQTTPALYWTFVLAVAGWGAGFFIAGLLTLVHGH